MLTTGERIRARRIGLGLSLERLALRLKLTLPGYSKATVWKSEKGLRQVPSHEIRHYARALECKPEDLLNGEVV